MDSLEALKYFVALCTLNFDKDGAKKVGIIKKDLEKLEKLNTLLGDNVLDDTNVGLNIVETLIARADKYKQRCNKLEQALKVLQERFVVELKAVDVDEFILQYNHIGSFIYITKKEYELLKELEND